MKKGPITGTFIDEITYDMPSSNWSQEQWRKDFDHMAEIGIDTLILARGFFEGKSIFPSRVFHTEDADDFAGFVLEEAANREMDVFFGLYISNLTWNDGDAGTELQQNKLFINEVLQRYSQYPSFKGWYIPHETCCDELNITEVMYGLSGMCKDKTPDKRVLISPFFKSDITCSGTALSPRQHYEEWDRIFCKIGQNIDICAFQDGTASIVQFDDYYGFTKKLCTKHGIHHWVNVETFERDVRSLYYPISFSILKQRLEHHEKYAEKIITFEFSHFLSPQAIDTSARNLNHLYKAYYNL